MADKTFSMTVTLPDEGAIPPKDQHKAIAEAVQKVLRDHFASKGLLTSKGLEKLTVDCCSYKAQQ